jgi:hypothetical protein
LVTKEIDLLGEHILAHLYFFLCKLSVSTMSLRLSANILELFFPAFHVHVCFIFWHTNIYIFTWLNQYFSLWSLPSVLVLRKTLP